MPNTFSTRRAVITAILIGGVAAALLDAADAIVAYCAILGLGPVAVYQFVASGMLGQQAFTGGLSTALLGLAVHFLIAFSAAAAFTIAALQVRLLRDRWVVSGLAFGVSVYFFMNDVVIPLSAIPPAPFSFALFVNGVLGHALLVGLPIAYSAQRYVPLPVKS